MKSKKLLFSALLMAGGLFTFLTLTSTGNASSGVMGASTTGCSCHGSANSATTIEITGIPATGWVAGTAYSVTLAVKNSTKAAAGFDLTVTGGTISGAPANTMLMGGTEIHHTAPKLAASGSTTWAFTWTAPASGSSVTFNVAGNAVNNTGNQNGDEWALASLVFNKAIPASVQNVQQNSFNLYPNPAGDFIRISLTGNEKPVFTLRSALGATIPCQVEMIRGTEYQLNTTALPAGYYFLTTKQGDQLHTESFSKQ